ncbi:MAG TPA: VWA domain-containing protein, partial [Brevundimonas sp.]|nr:VWA domain-containing protein [Brevundimonas sp.]
MPVLPLKQAMAGVMSLALASPIAPGAITQTGRPVDTDKPSDGVVSAAACAPFGFTLREERPIPTPRYVPPPVTRPIEPTKKEDRLAYV